ncbi:MAG: DMT family transporter [Chloroflexi bacterium]|nr:DMT family transporter [Chloroflexota bacterium]MQC16623.1 DMT family transporter [Chloroflexota bacterium]
MRPLHLFSLIALGTMWGASFMFIKVTLEEMTPLAVAWVRLGGGGVVMVLVVAMMRLRAPLAAQYWRNVTVLAVIGTALPYVLIAWGQQQIPSNVGAVLNGAMPFWVVLLSTIFLPAERLTPLRAMGVVMGFVGVAIIIGPDALDIGSATTQGQFAFLAATSSYAAGAVYIRRRMLKANPWVLATTQNWMAFALLTPVILGAGEVPDLAALSGRVMLAAVGLAVLAQGVGILIYYWLISNVEATQASFVTYLAPIAAQFWGWLVLAEVPGLVLIPGLTLVFGGMILLNRRPRSILPTVDASPPASHERR